MNGSRGASDCAQAQAQAQARGRSAAMAEVASLPTSAAIDPPGSGDGFVAGLRPTKAIINCPVIVQPDLPPR